MAKRVAKKGGVASYEELQKTTQLLPLDSTLFAPVEVLIKEKRDRIAEEIMKSEQTYVRSLNVIMQVFMKPMEEAIASKELPISEEHMGILFSAIPDLINVNTELLRSLIERLKTWGPQQTLGGVLLSLAPFLRLYTNYSLNFEKVTAVLEELDKKEKVKAWLEKKMEDPVCAGLDFGAYLIMPIQRIPRYRLLIEEFLHNTPQTHKDYKDIQASLDKLLAVAKDVNKAITDQENRDRMIKISKKLVDLKEELIAPSRYFIREGDLQKVCRKDRKKRHFFLFNDCLLYGQDQPGNKYKIAQSFELSTVAVKDLSDSPLRNLINAFQIKSSTKSFTVIANDNKEKGEWLQAFKDAQEKLTQANVTRLGPKKSSTDVAAPVWVPDSEVKACTICATKFTFTNRRHHCRQCGEIICAECWTHKRVLPGQGKVRVCDECYKKPADWTPGNDKLKNMQLSPRSAEDSSDDDEDSEVEVLFEVKALYDYNPDAAAMAKSQKLPFKAGEMLQVLQVDQSGWWLAELRGERGWVPASFLEEPPATI